MSASNISDSLAGLLHDPVWQFVFVYVIPTLFGIATIYGIYVTRRAQIGPRLAYHSVHRRLLGYKGQSLPSDIEVKFRGKPITRLDKLVLALWNAGNRTICGDDIVAADPLRITGNVSQLLDAKVVKSTRHSNNVRLSIQGVPEPGVLVEFDYLDANDGAVVEILFEMPEKRASPGPLLHGMIRGIPSGIRNYAQLFQMKAVTRFFWTIFSLAGAYMTGFLLWDISSGDATWRSYVGLPLSLAFFIFTLTMHWRYRRRHPRALSMPEFSFE